MELSSRQIESLESILGYRFTSKDLLVQSVTHPSYLLNTKDQIKNNQRLEFLGDSVIQLVLTETLYDKNPEKREGELTKERSSYARGEYMADIARRLGLQNFLLLKDSDRATGLANQDSALGDAFEAVIGAIYLDSDYVQTRKVVLSLYNYLDTNTDSDNKVANPKGKLQEIIQPIHGNNAIEYVTTDERGEPHNREFEVTVILNGQAVGKGEGRSKKEAAELAALQAISSIGKQYDS